MTLTWNDAEPPVLPPLRLAERARGALRLAGVLLLTALALGVFLIGRGLRAWVSKRVTFHFWIVRQWSRAMLHLMGVRLRIAGEPMETGGTLLANHASWADILALRAATLIYFVSKAEVRGWAGVGWIADVCGTVFIERRKEAAPRQRAELRDRMRKGQLLCIFPEGTSSDGLRVLPFRSTLLAALFEPEVKPVASAQPVTVNWIAPPVLPAAFYGWWGGMGFGDHIWQVLCRSVGGEVEVVFHPSRAVEGFPDRKALTRWAEETVRAGRRA